MRDRDGGNKRQGVMRHKWFQSWVAAFIASPLLIAQPVRATDLKLTAADGVTISGDDTAAQGSLRGTLLLFHQAGSNRHEYAPLTPRFTALGFRVIAIDQRSGGALFGKPNETARRLNHDPGYLAALPDLEAALAHAVATGAGKPVVAIGSSYSAALVFLLAARHPDQVAAIASFSPGEYLGHGASVKQSAAKLAIPIFVTSSADAGEIAAAKALLASAPSPNKVQFLPKRGVHGASTLRDDTNPGGAAENWAALGAFLDTVAPKSM